MSNNDLKGNTKRSHPVIDEDIASAYVISIEEEIEHKKIINKFQDCLISLIKNQEAKDSTSETCTANTRYKYTTDDLQHPSRLDLVNYFDKNVGFYTKEAAHNCMVFYCKLCNNIITVRIVREQNIQNLINLQGKILRLCWIV